MRKLLTWIRAHPWLALGAVLLIGAWTLNEALNAAAERRWQEYRTEGQKRGARLDFAYLLPPPIPDEENFASLPMFKRAFAAPGSAPNAWQEHFIAAGLLKERSINPVDGVLAALREYAPQIEEWRSAEDRPYSRFPVEWHKGWTSPLPHIVIIANAATIFQLQMRANQARGNPEAAYRDFKSAFVRLPRAAIRARMREREYCNRASAAVVHQRWCGSGERRVGEVAVAANQARSPRPPHRTQLSASNRWGETLSQSRV